MPTPNHLANPKNQKPFPRRMGSLGNFPKSSSAVPKQSDAQTQEVELHQLAKPNNRKLLPCTNGFAWELPITTPCIPRNEIFIIGESRLRRMSLPPSILYSGNGQTAQGEISCHASFVAR